ncbi:hypothetical protein HO133_007002 [Letharia lupina]|uniref:Uncharacterized protein n=1 Tax=Letharia lupina TaxID=560253 RepID=A0A8H6FHV0_9LECA|nr:uncharacterized protein HO133_007002 [Letharia lupina]KAF6228890.1 hypothetical protein HO133_007002 [Letharia lupina]
MSRRNTPPNTQAQTKAPRLQPNYKQPKTPNTRVQAPVPVPPQTGDYGQAASPNPRTNRHPSQNPDIPTTGATDQDKPTDTGTSLATTNAALDPEAIKHRSIKPAPHKPAAPTMESDDGEPECGKDESSEPSSTAARPRRPKRKPGELVRRMRQVEHPKQRRWSGVFLRCEDGTRARVQWSVPVTEACLPPVTCKGW